MRWVDNIFSFVWDISQLFLDAYQEVKGWWWPFNLLQHPLYGLFRVFWNLLTPIAHFGDWVDDVWNKVQNILTTEGVLGLLKGWFPWLEGVGSWFANRWKWFTTTVGDWWDTTKPTVLGWIDTAKQLAKDLVASIQKELSQVHTSWDNFWTLTWPQWTKTLDTLSSSFGNFWTITLPGLITGKAAGDLIDSTLKDWFPFYDDLAQLWGEVKLFFTNPLDWLVSKLEDWFWGEG